jgi:hypothetical protein
MKTIRFLILPIVLFIAGCSSTPLTEEEQFAKEDREILREEAFSAFLAECRNAGGRARIEGTGSSRSRRTRDQVPIPGPGESYWCEMRRY